MPKADDRSSTDGLEILSVGSLYGGPWDKKYWSSSRGKDRYPYPVGYCALRTHNGINYKMEILEGSSGPVFQITSCDGHSGSGQTPDIAWDTFQRKTSRIKLWHTKRFSCKVDGVEFFGFKNTLVQRLLRELLSSLDGASEQSFPSISVGDGSPATEGGIPLADMSKNSNLLSYLSKSRITRRRSTKYKTTNVIASRPDDQESSKKVQINEKVDKHVLSSSWREEYVIWNGVQDLPSTVNLNCHQDCSTLAAELSCQPYQPSSYCKDKCYSAQLERQHLEAGNYLQSTPVNSEHIEETLNVLQLDSLKCSDKVQIVNPPVGSEHKVQISETVNDSEVLEDSKITKNSLLYAPDTLDTQKEDSLFPNATSIEEPCKKKDEFGADNAVTFDEPAGESCPDEETYNDSAYSDFDSVGREAVKSMMEIILPQAVPLFAYSRKKKKRKCNPSKESPGTLRTSNENDKIQPSVDVATSGGIDGNSISNFKRQEDHVRNRYPSVQSKNIYVAPDSIENYKSEAELTNLVKWPADFTVFVEANSGKHKPSTDKWQMFSNRSSTIESGICKRKIGLQKETKTHHMEYHNSATSSSLDKPIIPEFVPNDQSEADVANQKQQISCPSHLVTDNLAADKLLEDHAQKLASPVSWTFDHNSSLVQKSMEICSDSEYASGIKSPVKIRQSVATSDAGEKQCIGAETYGSRNSNIYQSSYVDLCRRNYNRPLSESIICRNVGDGSLVKEEPSSFTNENKDAAPDTCSPRRQICDLLDNNMNEEETSNNLECNALLIGCYSHPKRISAVMLKIEADDDPSLGHPSFYGHSTIILPILKDVYGRDVPVETSALQFTPDARALVMLDSIQVPYCSERRFLCPCSTCASVSFEDNAVKIVQLNKGYVSLLVKLKTLYPVNSVLVCEPDCLVALDESGMLYLWFMNPVWRFSAPASSILCYLPISLFSWQNGHIYGKNDMEKCKDELMAATNTWLTELNNKRTYSPGEGGDIGVWILACTSSDSYGQDGCQPSNSQKSPGTWRLALLVKNVVIMGTSYPRSTAIGVSAGHGIIGTDEGTAYMWDLKDGNKVEILHNSKGVGVSLIATNDSTPSVTAVAGESGQLWIYKHE
ncbi:hypothetical protein V2J09_004135 [Rumex salicifolius]